MTKKSNPLFDAIKKLSKLKDGKKDTEVYPRPKNWDKEDKKAPKITKNLFWKLWKKHSGDDYDLDKVNLKVVYAVFNYLLGDDNFDKDMVVSNASSLNKGLFIYGSVGVGKTRLFDILHLVGKDLITNYGIKDLWFNKRMAQGIVSDYMESATNKDKHFRISDYHKGVLYIDDFGQEEAAFNRTEVVAEILFERHRLGKKTYITTNTKPSVISEKYGDRLFDRIVESYNIIKWEGESLRK